MKIVILYYLTGGSDRKTIYEHLYSFKKYSDADCTYVNAYYHLPPSLLHVRFDLVIYHYTFLSMKWGGSKYFRSFLNIHKKLKQLKGYKIAIPQDEYVYSRDVCSFFKEFNVKTVFTCLEESEWEKVYPRRLSGLDKYVTVFTGYVDEGSLKNITGFRKDHSIRKLDVGYRARKLPYWLGYQALKKWQLTDRFMEVMPESKLKYDLSNDYKDVFYGDGWYRFLGECRVVLGCEGGASLHDPHGKIRKKVETFINKFPNASFEETEKACFQGSDDNLKLFALSPRHFEACMTRTCQALIEGKYSGIFKPGIHYIEIKKDWSNISEVIGKIKDVKYCESIADNSYRDIIESGKYTYRSFVNLVLNSVPVKPSQNRDASIKAKENMHAFKTYVFYQIVELYKIVRILRNWYEYLYIRIVYSRKLRKWFASMKHYLRKIIRIFYRQKKERVIRVRIKRRPNFLVKFVRNVIKLIITPVKSTLKKWDSRYGSIVIVIK